MNKMLNLFTYLLIYLFTFSNIYGSTVGELASKIADSNPSMQYSFWVLNDAEGNSKAFLAKNNVDGSFRVWFFTPDKKWQPIHNASASDGFPAAAEVFANVTLNKENEQVSFGAIANVPEDEDANIKAQLLENASFDIGWYFWVTDGLPFLFKKLEGDQFRIWHFTPDKKWQPVHNASASDGFPAAENNLEGVSFDPAQGKLSVGKSLVKEIDKPEDKSEDKPKLPGGLILTSNAMKDGDFLDEQYASNVSPPLSWSFSSDVKDKAVIKSYALTLKDLDVNAYHWHMINMPSTVTSIPTGPISVYKGLPNDFGSPLYIGPFPPAGETHNYEFTVYGFADATITGKDDYQYAIYKSSIVVKYTGK